MIRTVLFRQSQVVNLDGWTAVLIKVIRLLVINVLHTKTILRQVQVVGIKVDSDRRIKATMHPVLADIKADSGRRIKVTIHPALAVIKAVSVRRIKAVRDRRLDKIVRRLIKIKTVMQNPSTIALVVRQNRLQRLK